MSEKLKPAEAESSRSNELLKEILSGTPLRIGLSALLGFLIGAIFMAAFNEDVVLTYGTFWSNPLLTFQLAGETILNGYGSLLRG
jgi:DNA integrity scanning protein DisA with diadenylate cyclase activity